MSNPGPADGDRDLLSRLNALRKSHINFEDTSHSTPISKAPNAELDPTPALALLGDLTARFDSLKGKGSRKPVDATSETLMTPPNIPELQGIDDDKTIEELLADLGPPDQREVGKHEEDEIENLLKHANTTLSQEKVSQVGLNVENSGQEKTGSPKEHHDIDLSVFEPHPGSEEDEVTEPARNDARSVEQEADDVLQRILDEIQVAPGSAEDDNSTSKSVHEVDDDWEVVQPDHSNALHSPAAHGSGLDLPSTPSKDPDPPHHSDGSDELTKQDTDLEARFASLSLPQTMPSVPSIIKSKMKPSPAPKGFTDAEIDTWCIICNDDATLRCIGCDGDLYCSNCWMEGHKGEDAGYEEKKHRAVQFAKGSGKPQKRRVMLGA